MKAQITAKRILAAFVIIMSLGFVTNSHGTSTDEKQVIRRPQNVEAHKIPQLKLDIIFVLDNSGSMIKNDPKFITRKVVTNFLDSHREGFRLGMVIFDKDARLVEPLTAITSPEATNKFLSSLDKLDYQGQFTNSPAGVERAIYELKERGNEEAQKIIILLTDGLVDTGNKNQDLEGEKWLKDHLTQESQKAGIRIFGIAFTDQADYRLMQILALKTDGEYYRAYNAEDIPDVFNKIISIITKPPPVRETLAPSTSTPVIAKAQKEPSKSAVPYQQTPAKQAPVQKGLALLPLVLSVLAILMGVIVLVVIFRGKTKDRIEPPIYKDIAKKPLPPDHPIFKAELIDTENIVSKDTLSLALSKESMSIGRDSSNDIVIPEESVSSLHATIEYKNGHFYLEDHRSTNGTSLNGRGIKENEPVRLKSGDKIHFAIYEFRFLLHDQAPFGETVMLQKDEI